MVAGPFFAAGTQTPGIQPNLVPGWIIPQAEIAVVYAVCAVCHGRRPADILTANSQRLALWENNVKFDRAIPANIAKVLEKIVGGIACALVVKYAGKLYCYRPGTTFRRLLRGLCIIDFVP